MKERISLLMGYENLADLSRCSDPENLSKSRMFLDFDRWHNIPASFNEAMKEGGRIFNIPIIPQKNIRAEILYDGRITPLDVEDFLGAVEIDYPYENPLFHSELLEVVSQNHYRFQTRYPTKTLTLPSLSEAVMLTPKRGDIERRKNEVGFSLLEELIFKDDLEKTLRNLYSLVADSITEGEREDDQHYNFSRLYSEFITTGKLKGDCKSISTFTAGLINALGLRSRCLNALICVKRPSGTGAFGKKTGFEVYGHRYAEVYIPKTKKQGVWILLDPANSLLFKFPEQEQFYAFSSLQLPKFDNPNKRAQIKISYI